MTQENEVAEPQPPVPPGTKMDLEHLIKDPEPEQQEIHPSPGPSTLKKTRDIKKIAVLVLLALVVVLGIVVYFLAKERTRALHEFETKLAQMESRLQTLQDKQNAALAQNDRAIESLKKELQKLKEQTGEHFAAEERILQELRGTRPATPQATMPPNTVEQYSRQTTEPTRPQEVAKPVEARPANDSARSKGEQTFVDFVERVLKKIFELIGNLFQVVWDWLSDILKKTA
jgi:TolA-binding protein